MGDKNLEAGHEKLVEYKKRKQKKMRQSSESTSTSQSDDSCSLPLPLLPKTTTTLSEMVLPDAELHSDSSIISEHLNSNSESIENDCSYQEIEISNIPDFSLTLQNLSDSDNDHISQETKPSSLNTSIKSSSNSLNKNVDVQSILNEILKSERFKSDSEKTLTKHASIQSNESSFNLFEGIDLNDSLVNDYSSKLNETRNKDDATLGTVAFNVDLSNVDKNENTKVKQLEELLTTKDTTIVALTAELESLRELTSSNQSTLSLNTSTTDYKLYHDELQSKLVEYQTALNHRDSVIQQLTEALQQSVLNREQLQEQSDYFSKEIIELQNQLTETSAIVRRHKWDIKKDSLLSTKDFTIQTDNIFFEMNETENIDVPDTLSKIDKTVKLKTDVKAGNENNMDFIAQDIVQSSSDGDKSVLDMELCCSKLEEVLNVSQLFLINDLRNCIETYVKHKVSECKHENENEVKILEDKLKNEKEDHEKEILKLRELLENIKCDSVDVVTLRQELVVKHAKEVEELRTYFEQKCADLEKHYSDEIFTQKSRRLSGSSSCSETSDCLYSSSKPVPGPGGDSLHVQIDVMKIDPTSHDFSNLNIDDLIKLKCDLSNMTKELDKYKLEEISKHELSLLKKNLNKYDFRSLLKYDLSNYKTEMQDKYHAELEILREDFENRIDALNVDNENKMQSLERRYIEEIESLKYDLYEALKNVNTAVQEVASSGEYELAEVVQSYERRLQEQVTSAKVDIINALEYQIQMLVENTSEDAVWPTELLQLRNRFANHYEKQKVELEKQHQEEIGKLKEEHRKILNGALERARRRSLKDDSLIYSDLDVIKERDNLKNTTAVLRQLIKELMKYFSECEEELNNTLVEELLKHGFENNLTELEVEINLNESSNSTCSDGVTKKRVHLTPRFEELLATLDHSVSSSLDSNLSVELKNELGECLKRLRSDANAILTLSMNLNKISKEDVDEKPEQSSYPSLQDKITSLTMQLVTETQIKKELTEELAEANKYIKNLEAERTSLDGQVEELIAKQKILEQDLGKAREKITELIENGHKEIISEGYGESSKIGSRNIGDCVSTLAELQDRARTLIAECDNSGDNPLIQLIEELCRESDRITEDAKSDHQDLLQQIEAADRKLRATCLFLEEQAAEREQERDEAQREISSLREQLREREKDRANCEQINKEVEQLEKQMYDMSKLIEENEFKHSEIEVEKNEAIEKIFVLRDIIRDLESQIEVKTVTENELKNLVFDLEELIKQQSKNNDELNKHLNSMKSVSEAQHKQQIEQLEDEVQRLRLNTEFVGSEGALKQIRTQLNDFEVNLDKRTRELETLHSRISNTTCSSPSEDMSLRDQIRPRTPTAFEECDLPLQQLARLKEKLIKHSRAEDAAVKKMNDLEMELTGFKNDFDEIQNERDMLQDQVSEQLVLISSLQIRLDDQRLRAEQVQKQTNTSLELRIYALESEIKNLTEIISGKDKSIKQLNKLIEETKKKLNDQEKELHEKQDDKIMEVLQTEIKKLHAENASLLAKINNDAQNAQVLPNLVDNILTDKNKDIEMLRVKLDKTQNELNTYQSLNFDHEQLKALSQLSSSERAFSDILSLISPESPEKMRMATKINESINETVYVVPNNSNVNESTYLRPNLKFETDLSSIELGRKPHIHYSVGTPTSTPNSTEIPKLEKRVHFDESIYHATIEKLHSEILELRNDLFTKEQVIQELGERLKLFNDLEANIEKLQQKLDYTENALEKATETFEGEQNSLKEIEKNLRIELAEKKMSLIDKQKQLELAEQDSFRKDQMYMNLAKEKRELEIAFNELRDKTQNKNIEATLNKKKEEILDLNKRLTEITHFAEIEINSKNEELKKLQDSYLKLQEEVNCKSNSLDEFKEKLNDCFNEIKQKDELNLKFSKELKNKEEQLNVLVKELEDKTKEIERFKVIKGEDERKSILGMEKKLKEMKDLLIDRETEIEILNEDTNRYQDDISKLENRLKSLRNSIESEYELILAQNKRDIAAKDLQIIKLTTDLEDSNRELTHLKDLVAKKNMIVNQMSEDSKSLRVNLETIQSKIQESGNVIDLKRRLEDEQQLNATLQAELNTLRSGVVNDNMITSIEEITGAVRKQLDYSARLDSSILNALNVDTENADVNVNDSKTKENLLFKLDELEHKYEKERETVNQLKTLLENDRKNLNIIQMEDSHIIEQLRIRLESVLENASEFEILLNAEKLAREELEIEFFKLKQKGISVSSTDNSKTELTEYKSLPVAESPEIVKLRNDIKFLQEENSHLQTEIKNLKRTKTEMESNLKFNKDMLDFRNLEIKKIGIELEKVKESERATKDKWLSCKAELDTKNYEIENSRILINEIEQEKKGMEKEINKLNENLKEVIERESKLIAASNEAQLKHIVPDKFVYKIKELTTLLKEHIRDNKQMSETVEKLTDERRFLQEKISQMEEIDIAKLPFDDPVARANHLFAKYLRSESYRKALIWQKKYLVALLATYQTYPLFSKEIPLPFLSEAVANHPNRSNGIKRFKAVATSLIAILRMQFLVQRWHSGRRGIYSQHYQSHHPSAAVHQFSRPIPSSLRDSTTQFQVGQPVSSQNFPIQNIPTFSNLQRLNSVNTVNSSSLTSPQHDCQVTIASENRQSTTPTSPIDLGPWSGVTPPSKDQMLRNKSTTQRSAPLSDGYHPLQAPGLLSKYIERYDQIQHRLGMTSQASST